MQYHFEIYTVPCDDVQCMLSFGFSNKNGMEVCSKEGLQVTDYLCKVGIIVLKAIFVLWIIADVLSEPLKYTKPNNKLSTKA